MDNMFLKPEKPFLLMFRDKEGSENVAWVETESELLSTVDELISYGCAILDAIEIGSYRDIELGENNNG